MDWIAYRIQRAKRYGTLRAWAKHTANKLTARRERVDYFSDGVGTRGKNLSFLDEPKFAQAWAEAHRLNAEGWGGNAPEIRWRAHVACWAAKHALSIEGDFVECGVHTGLLSRTVCQYLDFGRTDRKFWLFDTWKGIPTAGETPEEAAAVKQLNEKVYNFDAYPIAVRNFSEYGNVSLVQGVLPESLGNAALGAIAYLSIDLNNARAEKGVIEALYPKLSKGAVVLLDDYAFRGHLAQHEAWDEFAASVGAMILTLPTGQGLLIR